MTHFVGKITPVHDAGDPVSAGAALIQGADKSKAEKTRLTYLPLRIVVFGFFTFTLVIRLGFFFAP